MRNWGCSVLLPRCCPYIWRILGARCCTEARSSSGSQRTCGSGEMSVQPRKSQGFQGQVQRPLATECGMRPGVGGWGQEAASESSWLKEGRWEEGRKGDFGSTGQHHHGLGHACIQHSLQRLIHKRVIVCVVDWGSAQVKHDGEVEGCCFLQQPFQCWHCLILSLLPIRARQRFRPPEGLPL